MDHYGPLINPVNSHELVAVAECDSGARKQRLGGIVTISRSSTFTRPPGHGDGSDGSDGKTVDPEDPCHCGARYIAVNQRMRSLDKRWTCPAGCLGAVSKFFDEKIQKATKGHQAEFGRVRPLVGRLEVCGSALRPDDVVLHPFAQVGSRGVRDGYRL